MIIAKNLTNQSPYDDGAITRHCMTYRVGAVNTRVHPSVQQLPSIDYIRPMTFEFIIFKRLGIKIVHLQFSSWTRHFESTKRTGAIKYVVTIHPIELVTRKLLGLVLLGMKIIIDQISSVILNFLNRIGKASPSRAYLSFSTVIYTAMPAKLL